MEFLGGSPKAFALKVAVAAKANELAALLRMPLFTDMKAMADETQKWRMPSVVVGSSDHPLLEMMIKYVEKWRKRESARESERERIYRQGMY